MKCFPRVSLLDNIQKKLEKILRAGKSSVRAAFRARIILMAGEGRSNSSIAQSLNTSLGTVRKWVNRFNQNSCLETLKDAPRSGRPFTIPAIAKCEVVKFACSDVRSILPDENLWTIRSLQESVKRSTGTFISKSEISRILNHKHLRPHKIKMWLHSADPFFQQKVNAISKLYLHPPCHGIVLCIDEKSGMQAIERKRSLSADGEVRLDHEYKRNGTQTLIAAFEPKTGKVFGRCGKTRKKEDLMAFMEEVAKRYPEGEVHVIWDNLNIHHGYQWYEFNKRHGERFHFTYTPIHGSWVNQIEIWFGILQRKVLKYSSFQSEKELKDKVEKYIDYWNQKECHPFKWQFRGYQEEAA